MAVGAGVESSRLSMAVSAVAQAALVEGDIGCLLSRLCTEAVEVLGCSGARVMLIDDPADGSSASQVAAVSVPDDVPPAWAIPLRAGEQTIGTLDLYDCGSWALSPDGVLAAQTLADLAGGLTWQMRSQEQDHLLIEQLQHALDSRVVIEQAKGVLSAKLGIGVDEAFQIMRAAARTRRARLKDVAAQVISGDPPFDRRRADRGGTNGTPIRGREPARHGA